MNEELINKQIDKTYFRTFDKIRNQIMSNYNDIEPKELRKIINNRIHDKRPSKNIQKLYQVRVFSRFPNSWMTDIMDNGYNNNPRYWQLFININTRFATAYPLENKTSESIHNNLIKFVNKYHPRKLTSDEEPGLITKQNTDYLKNNKCGLFIVTEQNHTSLSIIDRFIRTLRDMNRPQEYPKTAQSTDKEYNYISLDKMNEFINVYNNSYHNSIKYTPKQMNDNKNLEEEYIINNIMRETRQRAIKDFNLSIGDYVRYLIPRNPFQKRRYNVSRETYKIDDILGNIYTIIAQDGSTMNLPRWRLIKVSDNENKRLGNTLGTDRGVIEEIIEEISPNRVKVRFKMPNGERYEKVINKRELLLPYPQFSDL